jgi:hypothetical protein
LRDQQRKDDTNDAQGATLQTRNRRLKLCIWNIRTVIISTTTIGKTARTETCPFALSSTLPPSTIL